MGAGQHRHVAPFVGEGGQFVAHLFDGRVVNPCHGVLERERDGRVVDVLRGEAEMYEFLVSPQSEAVHFFLDDVLYGFDVVVGDRFDLLHALGVVHLRRGAQQNFGRVASGFFCGLSHLGADARDIFSNCRHIS